MNLLTSTLDHKITATNHLIEMTIGEYASIAKDILQNNELQRRRVKTSNRSYSLLKDDIKVGCVIPPIVLAIFPGEDSLIENQLNTESIIDRVERDGRRLLILDGLQRTYTILDLLSEVQDDTILQQKIKSFPLRIEIYSGISKIGVLYRMLTLNTGQTPMSTRHQVEILYSDYKYGVDGLVFVSEADGYIASNNSEFKFSDVLDGFLSYITGDYLPIDREDLVSIIKNLEVLTREDKQKDLFKLFINSYNGFRERLKILADNWNFEMEGSSLFKKPFAFSINELFSKVQMIAGFGAALSFLTENGLIPNLLEIENDFERLKNENVQSGLDQMIHHLDEIQVNAKKIGNEQRMYFYYFVRSLFNHSNEGFLDISKSVDQAYRFYKANTL